MKAIIAVLLLAGAAFAATDLYSEFIDWTIQHERAYDNAYEHMQRYQNYKTNWALVQHLNRQHRGTFALNKFADLSAEEFAAKYLRPIDAEAVRAASTAGSLAWNPYRSYPDALDWRTKGAVNKVKDQANCGSCWAFSAVANMEGVYAVAHSELPSLSEQQLVDCEHDCMIYPGTTEKVCDEGCNGGLMPNAMTYAIREGMETEASYPYKGYDGTCKYDAAKATFHFSAWKWVDKTDDAMVAALNDLGTLSVGVDATYWSYYSGGIYDSTCGTALNHGVSVVGYGEESGKKYWIVRNSWGTSWGENGYMRLIRGKNKCNINNFVSTVIA